MSLEDFLSETPSPSTEDIGLPDDIGLPTGLEEGSSELLRLDDLDVIETTEIVTEEVKKSRTIKEIIKDSASGIPMKALKRKRGKKDVGKPEDVKKRKIVDENDENEEDGKEKESENVDQNKTSPEAPPPVVQQVSFTTQGIVINQGTVLREEEDYENYENIELVKVKTTYVTHAKRKKGRKWSSDEDEKFFTGVRMFGEDFETISRLFVTRKRREIKRKFKREEVTRKKKIEWCLKNRIPMDHEWLKRMSDKKDEAEGIVYDEDIEAVSSDEEIHPSQAQQNIPQPTQIILEQDGLSFIEVTPVLEAGQGPALPVTTGLDDEDNDWEISQGDEDEQHVGLPMDLTAGLQNQQNEDDLLPTDLFELVKQ